MTEKESTTSPSTLAHHAGLDGLRAIAVIVVIIFHSGLDWLPGGFLGVSVFFTLSGFLITSLLINECENTGRLDLKAFWGRRLRRLAPASLVAITGVIGLASWLSSNVEASRIRGDAISALTYVSNWRFVYAGHSYEELFAAPSPLQHLWSLSIEEQLYVAVPLVVAGLYATGLRRRGIGVAMLLAAVASGIAMTMASSHDFIYYGTHTRASELLIGAAVACLAGPALEKLAQRQRTWWSIGHVFPLVGLVVIARFTTVASPWLYSGLLLPFAALSAVCLIGALQYGPVRQLLSTKALVGMGQVSYGLYLFHWPVMVWLNSERLGLDGVRLFGIQVLVTGAVTVLSYVVIEQPIRRRKVLRSVKVSLPTFVVTLVGSILVASVILSSTTAAIDTNPEVLVTINTANTPISPVTTIANSATPSTLAPRVDRTQPFTILVIGDSTAENIATALAASSDGSVGVISAGVLGCPLLPVKAVRDRPNAQQDVSYCPDNLQLIREYLDQIDAVVMIAGVANQWAYQLPASDSWIDPSSPQYRTDLNTFLAGVHTIVASQGVPILVFETPPVRDNPDLLGDDIASLLTWAKVINEWDTTWSSVKLVPYADALSEPNTDEGKAERPDGVHLSIEFGQELAREVLIPRIRDKYFDVIDEMTEVGCLSSRGKLVLNKCRLG